MDTVYLLYCYSSPTSEREILGVYSSLEMIQKRYPDAEITKEPDLISIWNVDTSDEHMVAQSWDVY